MILGLFSNKSDHPFADLRELQHAVSNLPLGDSFKTLDEVMRWGQSLLESETLRPSQRFHAACRLDEAAQPHIRRLTRDYLQSPRLSRSEERRMWDINFGYWELFARLYGKCMTSSEGRDKNQGIDRNDFSLLLLRLVGALAHQNKWVYFRYGQSVNECWATLGAAYLAAEQAGCVHQVLQMYPDIEGTTTIHYEYLRAILLCASSPDSLQPLEIQLVHELIPLFLPHFVFTNVSSDDNVYWIDLTNSLPPMRLACSPMTLSPGLRFVSPGSVPETLNSLVNVISEGRIPEELELGDSVPLPLLRSVIRHLALYWAPMPPMRGHARHRVKSRLSVIHGFDAALQLFAVHNGGPDVQVESWVVEDVSLSGLGANIRMEPGDWLGLGSLLCLQPEGGDNWLLGVVRRYQKRSEDDIYVGIETLSRQVQTVVLVPHVASTVRKETPALWLKDSENLGQIRLVLPRGAFDFRASWTWAHGSNSGLLVPVTMLENGEDYELGYYREYIGAT